MTIEWSTQTREITLPWGDGELKVQVPESWNLVYPERESAPRPDPRPEIDIVLDAVENPVGMAPIRDRNLTGKKVVIIVDDNTRPTPVSTFFGKVLDLLEAAGASTADMVLMPALGIHTAMTDGEMATKVGRANLSRITWENHNAFDATNNTEFGTTSRGTPVFLNRPGVAAASTIGAHHRLLTDPPELFNRVGMDPRQNNFRLDFEEVKGMIAADILSINVVIDHERRIMAAFAGDPIGAHRLGTEYTKKAQGLQMAAQVDGVIVNSYPMEINFKQSMKCVGNALPALKPGGTVMGFLKADRGMDDLPLPAKMKMPRWLIKTLLRIIGPRHVFGLLQRIKKGLNAEETFLYYYILQLVRAHDLFLYAPSLTPEEAQRLFYFDHFTETGEVILKGVQKIGLHATVAVFPEGGATYPIVSNA